MGETTNLERGIVAVPGEGAELRPVGLGARVLAIAVTLLSGLILVGTPVIDAIKWRPPRRLIGIELIADKQLREDASWADGSKMKLLEHDYKLRSTSRLYAGTYYGSYLLKFLRETIPAGHAGPDGWLFLAERIETPGGPPEHAALRSAAEHAALARRLEARGSRYVVVPVPRKSAFVPEMLPLGVEPRPECDAAMAATFNSMGVETIDLYAAIGEDERADFYVKRDTHWTDFGIRRSAEEVARYLGQLKPEGERLGVIEPDEVVAFAGDLYGWTNTHPMFFSRDLAPPMKDVIWLDGERLPPPGNGARIAQVGTSFSGLALFADMIGHHIGEPLQSMDTVGGAPQTSLRRLIKVRGDAPYPELVIEELPAHMVYQGARNPSSWTLHGDSQAILALPPRGPMVQLPFGSRLTPENLPADGTFQVPTGRWIVQLEEGDLARGGGAAEILVELDMTLGTGRLNFQASPFRASFSNLQGQIRQALPVLSQGESCSEVRVGLSTQTTGQPVGATLRSASIAIFADPASEVRAAFRGTGTGQWIVEPGDVPIAPCATLVVSMPGARADGHLLDVVIEATSKDGQLTQSWAFERLNAGGLAVVAPGLLSGHTIGKVRLTGVPSTDAHAEEPPTLSIFQLRMP